MESLTADLSPVDGSHHAASNTVGIVLRSIMEISVSNRHEPECLTLVNVARSQRKAAVIFTEIPQNFGLIITSCIDDLCRAVLNDKACYRIADLRNQEIAFFECFTPDSYRPGSVAKRPTCTSYDRVHVDARHLIPRWERVTAREVLRCAGLPRGFPLW